MRNRVPSDETQWLQQLQQNDAQALAALMSAYYRDLYRYGAKFTRNDGLIKDCIQEVFISLWQRRATATTILSPRHYLLRALKNNVLKALYKKDRQPFPIDLPDEYDFSQEYSIERIIIERQISEDRAARLRKAVAQLSKRQHEVIYLKFYQHLDFAQIAEQMDISRQSVYNLMHEAIEKIRSALTQPPEKIKSLPRQ
jgi:RNA polymerase sigma factor (sigma-70 family)